MTVASTFEKGDLGFFSAVAQGRMRSEFPRPFARCARANSATFFYASFLSRNEFWNGNEREGKWPSVLTFADCSRNNRWSCPRIVHRQHTDLFFLSSAFSPSRARTISFLYLCGFIASSAVKYDISRSYFCIHSRASISRIDVIHGRVKFGKRENLEITDGRLRSSVAILKQHSWRTRRRIGNVCSNTC